MPLIRTCPNCGRHNRVKAGNIADAVRCGACKTSLQPIDEPIDADAALFDEVTREAKVPVLVDFWAEWCSPCHMAAPEVKRVAQQMAGRALVLKVDTDRHADLANRFGVRGIPNFVVMKNGQVVMQRAGVVPHTEMIRWLS